ncbi:MAG: hypothetical protein LKJ76_01905 [Lachnospiraceae bacterium]|jgi:hypothetical protein|nr:hypothetical protein [Lachnospiraceae bacterium]
MSVEKWEFDPPPVMRIQSNEEQPAEELRAEILRGLNEEEAGIRRLLSDAVRDLEGRTY